MRMAATAAVYNRLHNTSVGVVGGGIGSGTTSGVCMGILGHHHQLARSLERILEESHLSGELILTNRKLKDFPKTGTKYNLNDTVIAGIDANFIKNDFAPISLPKLVICGQKLVDYFVHILPTVIKVNKTKVVKKTSITGSKSKNEPQM